MVKHAFSERKLRSTGFEVIGLLMWCPLIGERPAPRSLQSTLRLAGDPRKLVRKAARKLWFPGLGCAQAVCVSGLRDLARPRERLGSCKKSQWVRSRGRFRATSQWSQESSPPPACSPLACMALVLQTASRCLWLVQQSEQSTALRLRKVYQVVSRVPIEAAAIPHDRAFSTWRTALASGRSLAGLKWA